MTDRPMKMSREQFEALFAAVELAGATAGLAAKNHARRLLVEPEQATTAKPIHDGPCRGGPLDGSSMAMDDDVVERPGGKYRWSWSWNEWHWRWEPDTDPDLTTFGELEAGEWFECPLSGDSMLKVAGWVEGQYQFNAVDLAGETHDFEAKALLRRLPKPEFKA